MSTEKWERARFVSLCDSPEKKVAPYAGVSFFRGCDVYTKYIISDKRYMRSIISYRKLFPLCGADRELVLRPHSPTRPAGRYYCDVYHILYPIRIVLHIGYLINI